MATYESIRRGLEEVGEGINRLKAINAQFLEALEKIAEHIPGSVGHPSALDCCVQMRDDAIAAIKAATEEGK